MCECIPEVAPLWVKWFLFMALIGAPLMLAVIMLTLAKFKKMGIYKGD